MENLAKTDFKKELEQLKKSLGKKGTIPRLPSFKTKGEILGWAGTEHKVTGNEMNQFVVILDETFTEKKVWETKVYKEFQSIYDTLNALDKEYIEGFMGTFNAVKTASEDSTTAIITLKERIATQQDSISDLDTIRTNAQKGATAVQPETLKSYVTTDDPRLIDARPASDVSAWAKEKQKPSYTAKEVGALSKDTKISEIDGYFDEHKLLEDKQDVIADLATIRRGAARGATALQKLSDKADTSYVDQQLQDITEKVNQEIESLRTALQTSQKELNNARQGHIKLKRVLIATSICTGTISLGALIALLILIL